MLTQMGRYEQLKVFLCHSSIDKTFVRKLAHDLTSLGVDAWFDEWELSPGDSLFDKIGDAIDRSAYFCVVLSPDAVSSNWCKTELREALASEMAGESKVIPLLYREVKTPAFLKGRVHIDFSKSYFEALARLAGLALAVDKKRLASAAAARPPRSMSAVRKLMTQSLDRHVLSIGRENFEKLQEIMEWDLSDRFAIIDRQTGIRREAS